MNDQMKSAQLFKPDHSGSSQDGLKGRILLNLPQLIWFYRMVLLHWQYNNKSKPGLWIKEEADE